MSSLVNAFNHKTIGIQFNKLKIITEAFRAEGFFLLRLCHFSLINMKSYKSSNLLIKRHLESLYQLFYRAH